MSKQTFIRSLLGGLGSSYGRSEQAFYDRQIEEREYEREQEAAKIESRLAAEQEALAADRYKKEGSIINTLLRGKQNGRELKPEERFDYMSRLSTEGIDRLQNLSGLQKKGNKYLQSGKYIYEVVDGMLNPDPVNKIPEEPEKPKRVGTKYGVHEESGEPGWAVGYTDGSSKFYPAPLKKGRSAGGDGEIESITDYDPIKFKKFMDPFSRDKNRLVDLKQQYREIIYDSNNELPAKRDEINELAYNNEQTLLSVMPKDTKKYVQQYYDIMRQGAAANNISMEELQTYNQEELKQDFADRMLKLKQDGVINSQQFRLLLLWSKFKFGYLIESIENARRKEIQQQ